MRNVLEEEVIEKAVAYLRTVLDTTPQEKWASEGLKQAFLNAKNNDFYKITNYGHIRTAFLKEIDNRLPHKESPAEIGLKVSRIEKTDRLFTITTDKGKFSIDGDDLFYNTLFRKKVFAELGVLIPAVDKATWEYTIGIWMSCLQKNESSSGDAIKEAITAFLADADERDEAFLRKGLPIIFKSTYRFRLSDLVRFAKREFDGHITRPAVSVMLRDLGFESVSDGKVRYWKINCEDYDKQNLRTAGDGQDDQGAL